MKNIAIVALLAAVMSLGALVACGGDTPPASSPSSTTMSAPADSSSPAPASSAAPK